MAGVLRKLSFQGLEGRKLMAADLGFAAPLGDGSAFVADSFSFGVEREMKESGEKGSTADGAVDAADYALWREHFGAAPPAASGDGRVDAADYTVWRDSLGGSMAAGEKYFAVRTAHILRCILFE